MGQMWALGESAMVMEQSGLVEARGGSWSKVTIPLGEATDATGLDGFPGMRLRPRKGSVGALLAVNSVTYFLTSSDFTQLLMLILILMVMVMVMVMDDKQMVCRDHWSIQLPPAPASPPPPPPPVLLPALAPGDQNKVPAGMLTVSPSHRSEISGLKSLRSCQCQRIKLRSSVGTEQATQALSILRTLEY